MFRLADARGRIGRGAIAAAMSLPLLFAAAVVRAQIPASAPRDLLGAMTAPAPSPFAVTADRLLIVPGQSIGSLSLGISVREAIARLGASKGTVALEDGTMMYRWFEPPSNSGIGIRTAPDGTVLRIWVLNDARYHTREGLRAGAGEADVRNALGPPTGVDVNDQTKEKTLKYDSLGIWFGIQLDSQYTFYNTVFDIGVQRPR